jgi:hypothetical protein
LAASPSMLPEASPSSVSPTSPWRFSVRGQALPQGQRQGGEAFAAGSANGGAVRLAQDHQRGSHDPCCVEPNARGSSFALKDAAYDLILDEPWVPTAFTKNRDRLLEAEVACKFLTELLNHRQVRAPFFCRRYTDCGLASMGSLLWHQLACTSAIARLLR